MESGMEGREETKKKENRKKSKKRKNGKKNTKERKGKEKTGEEEREYKKQASAGRVIVPGMETGVISSI